MLDQGRLKSELLRFFATPGGIRSHKDAEDRWAAAYHTYASSVEDISGDQAVNLSKDRFRAPLNFMSPRTAADFARMIDAAFVSYWTGVTFGITSIVPGLGVPCPNIGAGTMLFLSETTSLVVSVAPGVMAGALLPVLLTRGGSFHTQADLIARTMHGVTKSAVTVLITGLDTTPIPTGPLPVTNTCTIF